jgi:hypothetical protein
MAPRRLLGNLFELEDLGAKDLKGISGPVRAWAALYRDGIVWHSGRRYGSYST